MTKLWRYNPVTGYWVYVRTCQDDTAQEWLETFQKDEPNTLFRLADRKPKLPYQRR